MKPAYTENILEAPLYEMTCYCSNVRKGQILQAIREGARSIHDIKAMTGACSLGRCMELSPRGR